MSDERRCRICRCSAGEPCLVGSGPPGQATCHWVGDDLCSTCAPLAAVEAELENLPAEVAYRLGLACGEFRTTLGRTLR